MNDDERLKNASAWMEAALIHGYNELAKTATTLGEKVYFRMARDASLASAQERGVMIKMAAVEGPIVFEIGSAPPFIIFHERDIEGMRAAVAKFDQERAPECTGTSASWCPVCGDCSCPENDYGERTLDDDSCRLHSRRSKHAAQDAIPHTCGHSPPYGCPGCGGMTCIHIDDRGRILPRPPEPRHLPWPSDAEVACSKGDKACSEDCPQFAEDKT